MQHLVVFKFDRLRLISEFGDEHVLQQCLDVLRSFIPGVNYLEIKPKHSVKFALYEDASGGWTHVLLSGHTSPDDLKVYAEHPQHRELQARMAKCMLAPPIRIEMNDPKQASPSCCRPLSMWFPSDRIECENQRAKPPFLQQVVLFKFNNTALEDEFGRFECLRDTVNALQGTISTTTLRCLGPMEIKAKNPEPWPRYEDGSTGYTHVWISNFRCEEDLIKYSIDESQKQLWKKLQKISVDPALEIVLTAGPYSHY